MSRRLFILEFHFLGILQIETYWTFFKSYFWLGLELLEKCSCQTDIFIDYIIHT